MSWLKRNKCLKQLNYSETLKFPLSNASMPSFAAEYVPSFSHVIGFPSISSTNGFARARYDPAMTQLLSITDCLHRGHKLGGYSLFVRLLLIILQHLDTYTKFNSIHPLLHYCQPVQLLVQLIWETTPLLLLPLHHLDTTRIFWLLEQRFPPVAPTTTSFILSSASFKSLLVPILCCFNLLSLVFMKINAMTSSSLKHASTICLHRKKQRSS